MLARHSSARRRVAAQRIEAPRAAAVAGAGALLIVIALAFDAVPLLVPAIALVAIGAVAPGWAWLSAGGARARRRLAADSIVEDEPLQAKLEVRRGLLALPGAELIDPVTDSRFALTGPLSPVRGGRQATVDVIARFPRRGEHLLAAPTLVVSDPLELARVTATGSELAQRVLVLPRIEPVHWLAGERGLHFERRDGDAASEALAAVDLDGLRPYRVGTPASRIHWPAVARGAGLIERRLRADGDTRPLVVLDARVAPGAHPELLDAAVRAAASLALDLGRHGGCGLLLPGDQRVTPIDPELRRWPAAHRRLAIVQPSRGATGALAGLGAGGPMIYVTSSPAARTLAALTAAGHGLAVIVVPHAELDGGRPRGVPGRIHPVLDVAGCRGFALGAARRRDRVQRRAVVT